MTATMYHLMGCQLFFGSQIHGLLIISLNREELAALFLCSFEILVE